LGPIGTNQTGAKSLGLCLHSSLALSEAGLPLGLVQLNGYAPESAQGKKRHRPIEQKESYRWLEGFGEAMKIAALLPKTRIISVSDREADMFELFDFRRRQPGRKAELLVRAKTDRCLEETERKLFAELAAGALRKRVKITVPRQREHLAKASTPGRPGLEAREAEVEIRFQEVTLSAPNTAQTRNLQPIRLWAIYLVEKHPPVGAAPVEWLLLTTIEVRSVKQARRCIRWYCRRWRIEEWHRVLKSGCKILEHQNHSAEALLRAIAMDAVIAWRIMLLTLLGREHPELPCELLFNSVECAVLQLLAKKKQKINSPSVPP
jgi:IS4 transposase